MTSDPLLPALLALGVVLVVVSAVVLWRVPQARGWVVGAWAAGLVLLGLSRIVGRRGRSPRAVVGADAAARKGRADAEAVQAAAAKARADAVVGKPLPPKPTDARREAADRWNRKDRPSPTNPPPRSGTRRRP